jgi:protein phosphatase
MGGHAAGEVASAMACALVTEGIDQLQRDMAVGDAALNPMVAHRLTDAMVQWMADVSQKIIDRGQAQIQAKGMGTTCTALWFIDDEHALVAHVGDCRLYLQGAQDMGAVTRDHTLVEELVCRGLIKAAEAKRHPQAHILCRALGAQSGLSAECFILRVGTLDTFLIASDGLHAYLPDLEPLAAKLQAARGALQPTLEGLIQDAKEQGGHDNLTGVLVHLAAAGEDGPKGTDRPLAQELAALTRHPAVAPLPPMLLRRLAALTVPIVAQASTLQSAPLPPSGIYWVLAGTLTVQHPDGQIQHVGANDYWAPYPLGRLEDDDAPEPSLSAEGKLLYLSQTALQSACAAQPTLGAVLLHGLLCHRRQKAVDA